MKTARLEQLPVPKSQANPVAAYPDPAAPARYRGLHFLGESAAGNPQFLSQVENISDEGRSLQIVRLELEPERRAVGIADGPKLDAPGPETPFGLKSLWRAEDETFWFSDADAPALFQYDRSGAVRERWVPRDSGLSGADRLPRSLGPARIGPVVGFGGRLFLFTETPLGEKAPWIRIVEWQPELAMRRAEYFYELDSKKSRLVGAAAVARGRFLTAEVGESGVVRVFRVEMSGAPDIASSQWAQDTPLENLKGPVDLGVMGFRPVKKIPLFDMVGEGELDGFALVDYQTIAALRTGDKGAVLWLMRLEGKALSAGMTVENPKAVVEMSKRWARPNTETL